MRQGLSAIKAAAAAGLTSGTLLTAVWLTVKNEQEMNLCKSGSVMLVGRNRPLESLQGLNRWDWAQIADQVQPLAL